MASWIRVNGNSWGLDERLVVSRTACRRTWDRSALLKATKVKEDDAKK